MDNTEEQPKTELLGMSLDYDGGNTLHEAARWSRLQSIGTIICGGVVLLGILIGGPIWINNNGADLPGIGIVELVLLAMGVFFAAWLVAGIFLLRFTSRTRKGIQTQDQMTFNRALKCLKIYFVIMGVVSLFLLADFLYVLFTQLLT